MAKAGFWLRGAKGKLAGAVAQKGQNGTILREIVTPKNPKTEKQIYQRAVMATVMKAYSAGKDIFDHSIQGLERGGKTQQYFIARNAKLLRSNIASELAQVQAGTLQPTAAVNCAVAPKSLYAVPGAYMISEGTYEQKCFKWLDGDEFFTNYPLPSAAQDNRPDVGTGLWEISVKDMASDLGLVEGDIFTFVALVPGDSIVHNGVDQSGNYSDVAGTKQHNCTFGYFRMQVKSGVNSDTTVLQAESEDKLGVHLYDTEDNKFFEVTGSSNPGIFDFDDGDSLWPSKVDKGSIGVIRSRLDSDLRSTSFMYLRNGNSASSYNPIFGITTPYILPTWQKGADSLGTSELILESDQQGGFVQA